MGASAQQQPSPEETPTTAATTHDATTETTEMHHHHKCDAGDEIVSEEDADIKSNITHHSAAEDSELYKDMMQP